MEIINRDGSRIIIGSINHINFTKGTLTIDGNKIDISDNPTAPIIVKGNVGSIRTDSGDVTVKRKVEGDVQTMSGNVKAYVIGGYAKTMSGNINAKRIEGSASTMSGDVYGSR